MTTPIATAMAVPLVSAIQWEPFGAATGWNWHSTPAVQPHTRVFDTYGRLVRYSLGNVIRDLSYDAADRITGYTHYSPTGVAQTSLDQGFGYDELGRLTTITTSAASWVIGYDANGNRTGVSLNGSPSTYTTPTTQMLSRAASQPRHFRSVRSRRLRLATAFTERRSMKGYPHEFEAPARLLDVVRGHGRRVQRQQQRRLCRRR